MSVFTMPAIIVLAFYTNRKENRTTIYAVVLRGKKMKEKIYKEIIDILKEISEDGIDDIKIDEDLKEKGISSLMFIQLLVSLEEKYDFVFEDEMLDPEKLSNIDAVADYVLKMIRG